MGNFVRQTMEMNLGCDIHLYTERRVSGIWESADKWTPNEYAGEEGQPALEVDYKDRFYSSRNYDLFAILADVRNGSGFAGCDTGDGFVPISAPRGLPDDISIMVRDESERWGEDGHSHSWVTVADLLAYDWTQVATHRGWVDPIDWAQWRDNGNPREWCGSVGGGRVTHISPDAFEKAWTTLRELRGYPETRRASAHIREIMGGNPDLEDFTNSLGGGSPFCQVQWSRPYYDSTKEFWGATIPRLLRLGAHADVRIVFWFDN